MSESMSPRVLLVILGFIGLLYIYVLLSDLRGYLRRRNPAEDRARTVEYYKAMDAAHHLVYRDDVVELPLIAKVIAWNNGDLVTAYDQYGHIMLDYCGPCLLVIPKIDAVYSGPWLDGDWFEESLEPLELHILYEDGEL